MIQLGELGEAGVFGEGAVRGLIGLAADTVFLPLGSVRTALPSERGAAVSSLVRDFVPVDALPTGCASTTRPCCGRSSSKVVDPDTAATGVSTKAAVPPAINHLVRVRIQLSEPLRDEISGRSR